MIRIAILDDSDTDRKLMEYVTKRYFAGRGVPCDVRSFSRWQTLFAELSEETYYDIFLLDMELPEKTDADLYHEAVNVMAETHYPSEELYEAVKQHFSKSEKSAFVTVKEGDTTLTQGREEIAKDPSGATIYADNFCTFGMKPWYKSLKNNIEILTGNIIEQESFPKYEKEKKEAVTGLETYNLTEKVSWKILTNEENINIKGRMIGGCLDIITDLFGTRFDKTKDFLEKYNEDGIIWYFDICELSSESIIRILWKLKDNDWFKYTKGILFSRCQFTTSYYDITYEDAIKHALQDLNIPLIINVDIGHVSPRMTIINGALATVISSNGKGKINFILK